MNEDQTARANLTRAGVLAAARRWIGTPYRHQASLIGLGCDCLGLIRGVWRDVIGPEPERPGAYSASWAEFAAGEPLLEAAGRHLAPVPDGDIRAASILFFRWHDHVAAKHCGIATGSGWFLHAHEGAAVAEVPLIAPWRRRLVAVFDFPDLVD